MVSLDEAVLSKLKIHGQDFEILVDCDKALALKEGKPVDIRDVLAVEKVFKDAKKGDLAPETAMKQIFHTNNPLEVAKEIIKKGEIQLTSDYRNRLREEKKKAIVDIIHKRGIDPRTGLPHPPTRIENAFLEAKVHIDEFKSVEEQVSDIIQKLRPILPIKFETRQIAIKIPAVYAAKSYGTVKQFSKLLKEEWQPNGDLVVLVEIQAGAQEGFFSQLNTLTKGEVETKIVERK